jgi:hypothetical protein
LYALTSLPEDQVNIQRWSKFEEALLNYSERDNGRDYYIFVLDKGTGNVYLTSLKSLRSLTSNGNNLPFQIKWAENLEPEQKSFEEAKKLIIGAYKKSVTAKINAHPLASQL